MVVAYGATPVLDGVSLAVAKGEFVALLGASGCGKTTLLRSVAGFVPTRSGEILVGGRDIASLPPERRKTALVFQSYALWPHMTAAQNIGYGLKVKGWARPKIAARVEEMLQLLQLQGLGQRNVTALSGGQRQRVALGRALAVEPELLLLDEPLSNLDARIRHELRHEIRTLQQRLGITALHVTHDREEAMVMADRIAIMDAGAIVQLDTPEGLWHRPASPFVARFMGAENMVRLAVERAGEHLIVRPPGAPAPSTLGIGAGGAHLAGAPTATMQAHFRSSAAELAPAETRGQNLLMLQGRVSQVAYLGEAWRHTVQLEDGSCLVDHEERHEPGSVTGIAVPQGALHLFPLGDAASPAEPARE